jgi:hypothetical protein
LHWKTKKKSTQEENATRDVRDVNEREREGRQAGSKWAWREGGREGRKSETGNKRTKLTPVEYWER